MRRGVSSGGGGSSLGYLFGGGEEGQNPTTKKVETPKKQVEVLSKEPTQKPNAAAPPAEVINKETPAGVPGNTSNNYFRADGQNRGNFLTVCFGSQSLCTLNQICQSLLMKLWLAIALSDNIQGECALDLKFLTFRFPCFSLLGTQINVFNYCSAHACHLKGLWPSRR